MRLESIIITITMTLAILKIAGEISMNWWQILAVLWMPIVLLLALGIISGVIIVIHGNLKTKDGSQENH